MLIILLFLFLILKPIVIKRRNQSKMEAKINAIRIVIMLRLYMKNIIKIRIRDMTTINLIITRTIITIMIITKISITIRAGIIKNDMAVSVKRVLYHPKNLTLTMTIIISIKITKRIIIMKKIITKTKTIETIKITTANIK